MSGLAADKGHACVPGLTASMSVAPVAIECHVDFCDLSCCLGPCWGTEAMLPLEAMVLSCASQLLRVMSGFMAL